MRVDHRRPNVLVAQQFLDRANVVPVDQQVRGKGMPERVAGGPLVQPGLAHSLRNGRMAGKARFEAGPGDSTLLQGDQTTSISSFRSSNGHSAGGGA